MLATNGLICCLLLGAQAQTVQPAEEHPLMPVLRVAYDRYGRIDREVKDYSCTLVKRERVNGRLLDHEYIFVMLRHEQVRNGRRMKPFGVYLRFLGPTELKGREVLYVQGKYKGQMIVRNGGPRFGYLTKALAPDSELALHDNRYPVTDIGIKNLLKKLLDVGTEELQYDECEVTFISGAKIDDRACTVIQVTHPVRREYFRYNVARIFIDDQLQLPIRYASYDWPEEEDGQPQLLEEYTYLNLTLNVGLKDRDFDYRNKKYHFSEAFSP